MKTSIEALALSLGHALHSNEGLLSVVEEKTRWDRDQGKIVRCDETTRRPFENELSVRLFLQTWSSTGLGFGNSQTMSGSAMTDAYTIIVSGPAGDACVYFGGLFAYHIRRPNKHFYNCMSLCQMAAVDGAKEQYESLIPVELLTDFYSPNAPQIRDYRLFLAGTFVHLDASAEKAFLICDGRRFAVVKPEIEETESDELPVAVEGLNFQRIAP